MMHNEHKPKISVCIVTYNQKGYIKDCLLSVLAQGYDVNMEVLVGDDASTDGTSEIVRNIAEKYPDTVTAFRHEKNLGAHRNCLFLVERASGDFIAHLDGDDFWMPGKLEAQLSFLERHPECVAVYSNAVLINEDKDIVGVFNRPQPETFDTNYLLDKGNFLNNSSLLYRRCVKNLLLEEPLPFIDYQIHTKFSSKSKLGYLNKMLVAYRVGANNSLTAIMPDKVHEYYYNTFGQIDPKVDLSSAYATFLSDALYVSIRSSKYKFGIRWMNRMLKDGKLANPKVIVLSLCYLLDKLTVRSFFKLLQRIVGFSILSRR